MKTLKKLFIKTNNKIFKDKYEKPAVIFICGAPRSGTHLLNAIISNSSDVHPVLQEATPVTLILDAYRRCLTHNKSFPKSYFECENDIKAFYSNSLNEFIEYQYGYRKSSILVFRAPILATYTKEIMELLSISNVKYKIMCMVRDPRDVIASFIVAERNRLNSGNTKTYEIDDFEELSKNFYEKYYNPILRFYEKSIVKLVKYENLVTNPKDEINEIIKYLGLNMPNDNLINPWGNTEAVLSQDHKIYGGWITPLYMNEISSSSINNHEKIISQSDCEIIMNRCRQVYDKLANLM